MNLLAIETATETVSVALEVNGEVIERFEHAPRKHAELLLPWVEAVLGEAAVFLLSMPSRSAGGREVLPACV